MTFAFDRAPFKWAAYRIVRHVREIMRARSSRTEWLGRGDWALTWPGGGDRAHLQKTLQSAQMKRLTLGDEAAFHGAQMDRATRVCCGCNAGPCSTDHWLFDCTLPAAAARRFALLHDVKRVGCRLQVLDGGKEHDATLLTAQALMGQHARGTAERKVAFRWCVGCIPRPVVTDKEARSLAVNALTTCARSLVAARAEFAEAHDNFLEAEKSRALILKLVARWRRRVALGGPTRWWGRKCARGEVLAPASVLCATPLPRGPSDLTRRRATGLVHNSTMTHRSWRQLEASSNGRDVRRGDNMSDWSDSAKEWQAAITILVITWGECTRLGFLNLIHTRDFERRIIAMQAMLAICSAHSGGPGAVERKATAVKRTHDRAIKKARADRMAAQFSMTMGIGGEGNITLAEGLVDVDVTFNGHKRARWSRSRMKGADSRSHSAGGASRRTGGRRRAASGWDSSESESSDSGPEVAVKYGCAGGGGAEVDVGDRIRIYWTGEEV